MENEFLQNSNWKKRKLILETKLQMETLCVFATKHHYKVNYHICRLEILVSFAAPKSDTLNYVYVVFLVHFIKFRDTTLDGSRPIYSTHFLLNPWRLSVQ
jgi:hypothetical protein